MLKIIAITKKKDFYRIGENFNYSNWYSSREVQDVEVTNGDVVEITHEKVGKENVLKSIKVVGKADNQTTKKEWRSKSPEESESIRKQAVGKMVAETIKAVDSVSITNVEELIDKLFLKYNELTK